MNTQAIERVPESGVRWHPYADLFPWIEGPAFDQLVEDIRKHGVREPVVFIDGQILDGRNRYMAARQLNIEYPRTEYQGDDPLGFVISHNLTRRHLTESQRAMVAAKLAKMPVGGNQHSEGLPIGRASEMLNVGDRSVARAKEVQEQGAPELIAAVDAGKVSVSAAAAIASLPKEEQEKAVAAGPKAVVEAAKSAREAKQAENYAARDAARAAQSPSVKAAIEAKEDRQVRGKKPVQEDDLVERIDELEGLNQALTSENATLKQQVVILEPMRLEYERGGFAEIIKGLAEQIRVLKTRVEGESKKAKDWRVSAEFWKKKALELGYSDRVTIDVGSEASNG